MNLKNKKYNITYRIKNKEKNLNKYSIRAVIVFSNESFDISFRIYKL